METSATILSVSLNLFTKQSMRLLKKCVFVFTGNKMCVVAKLLNWIVFYPVSLAQPATLFVKEMQRVGSAQNFLMPDPI